MTTPEFHTFTVETTGDGPSSVASGRLPDPVQTFTIDPASAFGAANAGAHIPVQAFTAVKAATEELGAAEEAADPEAMREAASRLLTAANEAEAGR